jgi:hypothetical protein
VSVTDCTVRVESSQPITTTFRSPAVCPATYGTLTAVALFGTADEFA